MQSIQTISENTIYVGASDRRLAKFENLFPIPRGVSYNAYVILDEKTALLDTADASVGAQFLENVAAALDGRKLDYLIVDHMEPDHAAMIEAVLVRWPDLRLVVNGAFIFAASLPCVLGYNLWSGFHPLLGKDVLDSEDFIVSNLLLPIGSLIYPPRSACFANMSPEVNASVWRIYLFTK